MNNSPSPLSPASNPATPASRPARSPGLRRCLIVAGEVSGDLHAAALMRALQRLSPDDWVFSGIGGDAMRAAGAELLYHTDDMGVMGVWEVLCRLRFFRRVLNEMTDRMQTDPPHLLLTVDYPGFNLRLAARAKALGIPVVHYICPKVWAWNRGRIPRIAASLDKLLSVFPFEAKYFRDTGLEVSFVGHPLVDRIRETLAEPPTNLPWGEGLRLALLPGSRAGEIARLLPGMLSAASRVERVSGPLSCLIPAPTDAARIQAQALLERQRDRPAATTIIRGQSRHVLHQARAALVASGTATLEACLLRCPTVIVYRVAWPTYLLGRLLIRGVRHIGLANIMAGKTVSPELIQGAFTPARAAERLLPLLHDSPERRNMLTEMDQVNTALGDGQADNAAAAAVLDTLARTSRNVQ